MANMLLIVTPDRQFAAPKIFGPWAVPLKTKNIPMEYVAEGQRSETASCGNLWPLLAWQREGPPQSYQVHHAMVDFLNNMDY